MNHLNVTISRVDWHENLPENGYLSRTSDGNVAAQFNLMHENCASHPAFQADNLLLAKLNLPSAIHILRQLCQAKNMCIKVCVFA